MLATRTGTLPATLFDLFKQTILANILAVHRPNEYWESHTQPALSPLDPADTHGFTHYYNSAPANISLARSLHFRLVDPLRSRHSTPSTAWLAMRCLPDARRFLFFSTDAAALLSIAAERKSLNILETKTECIQEDGVAILRGATMLLSDQWTASTLALIDPPDIDTPTDAEISPLALFCEIANRNIPALLAFTFTDLPSRIAIRKKLADALAKTHLTGHNIHRFEGALTHTNPAPSPIPSGFGLLCANIRPDALAAAERDLTPLQSLFTGTTLEPHTEGSWKYTSDRA
ncbi:MAG: hypothetical protein ACTHN5_16010 [Phycisphaerae bacterium]